MVIAHNMASMTAANQLKYNTIQKTKNVEKLSSGYRINRAADDAAGLQISEKMRAQIRGLERGEKNIQDGISWLQVADGAMNEVTSMVHRIRELAVYAANGTHSQSDRAAMNDEIIQLKKEINQTSDKAVFNDQKIFDKEYTAMKIEGCPSDIEIFDAAYDDRTGKVTYGGILFQGKRVNWDMIARDMVYIDTETGKEVFKEGNYHYRDAETGAELYFSCKEGDEVPKITRTIQVSATQEGISIDGEIVGWDKLLDEDGNSCTNGNYHEGEWSVDYAGIKITFTLGMDIRSFGDMIDGINACSSGKISYNITSAYSGSYEEQAIDVVDVKKIPYSNALKNAGVVNPEDVSYTVRAGQDKAANEWGIWLEDKNGTRIEDSYMTWVQMGIYSWMGGDYIQEDIVYEYTDTTQTGDTGVAFSFQLSEVTSLDSVIDGLDGMQIKGSEILTSYETTATVTTDAVNVIEGTVEIENPIYHEDEDGLGRDYDKKLDNVVIDERMSYDNATDDIALNFENTVVLNGNAAGTVADLEQDMEQYMTYVLKRKTRLALAGKNPQTADLGNGSLTDLVGTNNITTSGYFDDVLTLNLNTMEVTDGYSSTLMDGEDYPTAFIDFSNLGTGFTLDEMEGMGFNSTCKTCSNHYSVKFVSGGGTTTTAEGYAYTFKEENINYILEIDLDSLAAKGIDTGEELTEALVSISRECYDFHFTQYAAEGSKLYIFDDRSQSEGTTAATFDTKPFGDPLDEGTYTFSLSDSNGRNISAEYQYRFTDLKDQITVEMKEDDTNGDYVKAADGKSYILYESTIHINGEQRYALSVGYDNAADFDDAVGKYADEAVNKMISSTTFDISSTDFSYIQMTGNEYQNIAIGAEFDEVEVETFNDNVLRIQNSGEIEDVTKIPRVAISTAALNLSRASVMTEELALKTMTYADYALDYISERRSLYGAYQNRLETAYAINTNTRENLQASESRIRDADMAETMVKYSKENILEKVGQAMLAQANIGTDGVLALLQ